MRKMIRQITSKLFAGILAMTLVFSILMSATVYADSESDYITEANYLNELGLFLGGTNGYNLEAIPDRAQGAVMVVRLLGKEDEVLSNTYNHPFTDVPSWADPYVGYLYVNHITNGKGTTIYGSSDPLSATQYMTLMLRVLGYQDSEGDFLWDESLNMAYNLGIINGSEYLYYLNNDDEFIRDDMVHFSYEILFSTLKIAGISLYQRLVVEEAISPEEGLAGPNNTQDTESNEDEFGTDTTEVDVTTLATPEPEEPIPTPIQPVVTPQTSNVIPSSEISYPYTDVALPSYVSSPAELQFAIETMAFMMLDSVTFNVSGVANFDAVVEAAMDNIQLYPGYFSIINRYGYSYTSNRITVELYYNLTPQEVMNSRVTADSVINNIISPGMSEYDREIAIHDYLVNTIRYTQNVTNNYPYTMYGALVQGSAVCQGYAEAFDYLCELAGLEAMIATGDAYQGGSSVKHAWNIVKIDGSYYQVDVTWDDPTMTDGSNVLRYYYFNLTDAMIGIDHILDNRSYPTCNSTEANYYYYNDRVVNAMPELEAYIRTALMNKETEIDVSCIGFSPSMTTIGNILNNNIDTGWATCSYYVNTTVGIVSITELTYR